MSNNTLLRGGLMHTNKLPEDVFYPYEVVYATLVDSTTIGDQTPAWRTKTTRMS